MNRAVTVESLLQNAHDDASSLTKTREMLARTGIHRDDLPCTTVLNCFSLLANHDRETLVKNLSKDWPGLQAKGLTNGALSSTSSAKLRLMSHCLPYIDGIHDLFDRLNSVDSPPTPPQDIFTCGTDIQALWGQIAIVRFKGSELTAILIQPEPVFGLLPSLLQADTDGRLSGHFEIPVDTGRVAINVLCQNGTIYRHKINVRIAEA